MNSPFGTSSDPASAPAGGSPLAMTLAVDPSSEADTAHADDRDHRGEPGEQRTPAPSAEDAYPLIAAMAASRDRSAAAEQLVQHLAAQLPESSVRCGIGGSSLRRFFDHRLGWLEPENHLRSTAAEQWPHQVHRSVGVSQTDSSLVVSLPQSGGGRGRCLLWIEGRRAEPVRLPWLAPAAESLAAVLWSRPRWATPDWVQWSARRPALVIGAAALVLGSVMMWPIRYRVDCTAVVQPIRQRMISAPFEATLMKAHVQPGDSVKQGETLVVLDGRPLRLERESIQAEVQQVMKDHDIALASGKVAEAQQAELKHRGLERRRQLLTDRLARLKVLSPIDGVVIHGDLQGHVGTPLEAGQTLVEVAPLKQLAIEVEIPEYEIGYVEPGTEARVRIDAVGGESFRGSLERVDPAAEVREDRNVFIGRMTIENERGEVRPGMRGEAVAYGPLRPIAWRWIRSAVEGAAWWLGY